MQITGSRINLKQAQISGVGPVTMIDAETIQRTGAICGCKLAMASGSRPNFEMLAFQPRLPRFGTFFSWRSSSVLLAC